MKQTLFFLLMSASIVQAQFIKVSWPAPGWVEIHDGASKRREQKPVDQVYFTWDSAGANSNITVYWSIYSRSVTLDKFQNELGVPYSLVSGDAAMKAFNAKSPGANGKFGALTATNYADAQSQTAALPAGVGAIVKVQSDESPGNVGTGPGSSNPTTYYVYYPGSGLVQLTTYPSN